MKYSNDKLKISFRLNYIKDLFLKSIFIVLITSCGLSNEDEPTRSVGNKENQTIIVGAQRMTFYIDSLKGKAVGIVGNQSSVVRKNQFSEEYVHLVDTLLSGGINVTKVFSPEHGFRGKADAGAHVKNQNDKKTGLPIVSLYGKNKKPSKESLQGIDILLFDIQDVGVRFYTYISTLHYVMEACAENNIQLIVLDRPNPNGHYMDGPILEKKYTSFVGMHPVPVVHGMTIGEYAKMINGEKWLKNEVQCRLTIVPCKGYVHTSEYQLPIPPSPNLRSALSIELYPSLCFLEATTVSVGRGTDHPFEQFGHPDFPDSLYSFVPKSVEGATDPKHKNRMCYGIKIDSISAVDRGSLNLSYLIKCNELMNGKLLIDREPFFNLLAGNSALLEQIKNGKSEEEIKATWKVGLDNFRVTRAKYLLYE